MTDQQKEIDALVAGILTKLADIPYDQYPDITYEIDKLINLKPSARPSVYRMAYERGLLNWQQTDAGSIVQDVLAANKKAVEQYRQGDTKVLGFLIGQMVKAGADPKAAKEALQEALTK